NVLALVDCDAVVAEPASRADSRSDSIISNSSSDRSSPLPVGIVHRPSSSVISPSFSSPDRSSPLREHRISAVVVCSCPLLSSLLTRPLVYRRPPCMAAPWLPAEDDELRGLAAKYVAS
ncbi:hypothetical protein BVRB_027470, partial [Beta vulgaris subsp. vulgaris]